MLSEREQATFREIQQQLADDPDSGHVFHAAPPVQPRPWTRRIYAGAIAVAILWAVVMVLFGSFGAATLMIVIAVALGLANHSETRSQRLRDAGAPDD